MKALTLACLSLALLSASAIASAQAQSWTGKASYYRGQGKLTAAHRFLPFGTRVRVTNLENGRAASVTITDRGPFVRGRIIDVSKGAARLLGMRGAGVARVRVDRF